jgi:hypothetical protein
VRGWIATAVKDSSATVAADACLVAEAQARRDHRLKLKAVVSGIGRRRVLYAPIGATAVA